MIINMSTRMSSHRIATLVASVAVTAALTTASAQTRIVPPANKYAPSDDVKLGQEAAQQVRKEMPLMNDETVDDWVERVGQRLVAAIPQDLRHSEFRYTF